MVGHLHRGVVLPSSSVGRPNAERRLFSKVGATNPVSEIE